jgi:hypothetical protein
MCRHSGGARQILDVDIMIVIRLFVEMIRRFDHTCATRRVEYPRDVGSRIK